MSLNIITSFLDNFKEICALMSIHAWGYSLIIDDTVTMLIELLLGQHVSLREKVANSISVILSSVKEQDRQNKVLKRILELSHSEKNNFRIASLMLYIKLARSFGQEMCSSIIATQVLSMAMFDQDSFVKQLSMSAMVKISEVVGGRFFKDKFLNWYLERCQESNDKMRLHCANILPEAALQVDQTTREVLFSEIMINFLGDQNKQVALMAKKRLMVFLPSLEGMAVDARLIQGLKQISSKENSAADKFQLLIIFSQNLANLIDFLGVKHEQLLIDLFQCCADCDSQEVKLNLCDKLHQIIESIPEAIAKKIVVSLIDRYIKFGTDEMREILAQNFSKIISRYKEEELREELIDSFMLLANNSKKWRIRYCFAKQISELYKLFGLKVIQRVIFPISFKLCNDSVAQIREEASKNVCSVLLYKAPMVLSYIKTFMGYMKGYAQSQRYFQRQSFLWMCQGCLLNNQQFFQQHLLADFIVLSGDPVKLIRNLQADLLERLWLRLNASLKEKLQDTRERLMPYNLSR